MFSGGDALVSSGIMESLLQVLDWKAFEPMNITVSWGETGRVRGREEERERRTKAEKKSDRKGERGYVLCCLHCLVSPVWLSLRVHLSHWCHVLVVRSNARSMCPW